MEWNVFKQNFESLANQKIIWMQDELSKIRSGRVNLNIFNDVLVEAYGELLPLNQVANMQIVDARNLVIKAYDKSQLIAISNGILKANLGVTPIVNGDNVRITFPPQTEENRIINVKRAKEILEQAKAMIRNVRHDVQDKIKKTDGVSEDLIKYFQNELDKITKEYNQKLESIFIAKEQELMRM